MHPSGDMREPFVDVAVWTVKLESEPQRLEQLRRILNPAEQVRAAALPSPLLQRRFIVARGALRMLLGHIRNEDPSEIAFRYGPAGRPNIEGGPWFSVSHTGDAAVIATARVPIGVDIERVRPLVWQGSIARHVLTETERGRLEGAGEDEAGWAFFKQWTAKEAYLKATGLGMQIPLRCVDVSWDPPRVGHGHAPPLALAASDAIPQHALAVVVTVGRPTVALTKEVSSWLAA